MVKISQYILSRATAPQARLLFNRTYAYKQVHSSRPFAGFRDWVSYVDVKGTTGRWIAPPGSKRSEDDVCLYFIHGERGSVRVRRSRVLTPFWLCRWWLPVS